MILKLIESIGSEGLISFIAVRVAIILGCWTLMIFGSLIDFWSGTSAAKAIGEKLISKGFRKTIQKDASYFQVLLFALLFDTLGTCFLSFYKLPLATIICTAAILIIEGRSVIENNRRKKAHAADIPEIVRMIVQAGTAEQAKKILDSFNIYEHENTN